MTAKSRVASLVAAALFGAGAAVAEDIKPCALLTSAEVQSVATSKIGDGAASYLAPTASHVCEWKWVEKNFGPSLQVAVSDASKMFPGMDGATIKEGILGGRRGLPKNTTLVPGVGEAANYPQNSPKSGTATAYLKGKILTIVYQCPDAPAKKDRVIGLLKAAAARL